jgi:predicted permease
MKDWRYAIRQLVKRPGLSAVVVLMLAFGVGTTTAIFSMYREVLLRPLPVPQPDRLVNLQAPGPKPGMNSCSGAGECEYVFSYPMFRDLEAKQTVFTGLAGHRDFRANLAYAGATSAGSGMLVSGSYFRVLGLRAALGRLIAPEDEPRVGESAVAVLSHAYWRTHFGADPSVVGGTVTVNGQPLTIVGVAPEGFSGTTIGVRPDVFVPLTLRWLMEPTAPRDQDSRTSYWLYVFARLAPGVSMQQAAASLNGVYSGILADVEVPLNTFLPPDRLQRFREKQIVIEPGARGQSSVPVHTAQPLTLLLGVTVLVLLIVCVNIANLLLARGAARTGEMAVRASIGATRRRLAAQLFTESAVLAAVGGLLSLPVAAATSSLIAAVLPSEVGGLIDFGLNRAAMLFTAAVSIATVLLFGAAPAIQSTRPDLGSRIRGQSPQSVGGRGVARFRSLLATTQIAFSMVLLVLAGLFTRSLVNIARVDLGMNVDSLVTFMVSPRLNGYDKQRVMSVYDGIEAALREQPGVAGVGTSYIPLLSNSDWGGGVTIDAADGTEARRDSNVKVNEVGNDFFRTLSIPLLAGRVFTEADGPGAPRVAVVNESFVRKFGLGNDAIGKRFARDGADARDTEIVGVVADAKYSTVKGEIPAQYFLPRRQDDNIGTLAFYVRGSVDSAALLRTIPRLVARIDPDLPVSNLATMRSEVEANVFLDRLVAILSAAFAALATFLAAIGLYGVLAYNVTQRTRELGLRLALGATPRRLRGMVLRQVGLMAAIGGAVGLAAAAALGRASAALLFGLSGYDPAVLAAAVVLLTAVVLAAGLVPAYRASRVAPMEALRYE